MSFAKGLARVKKRIGRVTGRGTLAHAAVAKTKIKFDKMQHLVQAAKGKMDLGGYHDANMRIKKLNAMISKSQINRDATDVAKGAALVGGVYAASRLGDKKRKEKK